MIGAQLRNVAILATFAISCCSSSCSDAGEARAEDRWLSPELASREFGLEISRVTIQSGQIMGAVKNASTRGYGSADLLVHIYDPQGARLKQQIIIIRNLWAGETVRINETVVYLTRAEQKGATAEVKAVNVQP
jgi:hypothetical protein